VTITRVIKVTKNTIKIGRVGRPLEGVGADAERGDAANNGTCTSAASYPSIAIPVPVAMQPWASVALVASVRLGWGSGCREQEEASLGRATPMALQAFIVARRVAGTGSVLDVLEHEGDATGTGVSDRPGATASKLKLPKVGWHMSPTSAATMRGRSESLPARLATRPGSGSPFTTTPSWSTAAALAIAESDNRVYAVPLRLASITDRAVATAMLSLGVNSGVHAGDSYTSADWAAFSGSSSSLRR
jgi:hypothetical protein